MSPICFANLVNLADRTLGARVVGSSDDYFASAENLIAKGSATFDPTKYTDRGKWMDGWESRRRRSTGHDFCIVELGVPGECAAFDVDTAHFNGNQPAFASIDGVLTTPGASLPELESAGFVELLPQVPLQPTTQNLFAAERRMAVNYLRLNIFPDGGVARLRAFGRVVPRWDLDAADELTRGRVRPGAVDLAALVNGARPLACSNAHFSPMHQILLPGRAEGMNGGWETRRRRGPGHDWLILELGARGTPELLEIDTFHFKGNFPDRCSVDVLDLPGTPPATALIASDRWQALLPETRVGADTRHFFDKLPPLAATHVRLNVFPDGGVSRFRLWGSRDVHTTLNQLSPTDAEHALRACCASHVWVAKMLEHRPFPTSDSVLAAAAEIWAELGRSDILEAFAGHPKIGESLDTLRERFAKTAHWSSQEQAQVAVAKDELLEELRQLNVAYEQRFGYIFIVCATGKSAEEMRDLLKARMHHSAEEELRVAALEQAKITRIRLEKLQVSEVKS